VVIGGAEIYREALPLAQRLYLTEVHASIEGDAWLPKIDWADWREVQRERHAAGGLRAAREIAAHLCKTVCYLCECPWAKVSPKYTDWFSTVFAKWL
jgi:dihydrofolate reductase